MLDVRLRVIMGFLFYNEFCRLVGLTVGRVCLLAEYFKCLIFFRFVLEMSLLVSIFCRHAVICMIFTEFVGLLI